MRRAARWEAPSFGTGNPVLRRSPQPTATTNTAAIATTPHTTMLTTPKLPDRDERFDHFAAAAA